MADFGELSEQFEASFAELQAALTGDKEKLARLDAALTETKAQIGALEQLVARRGGGDQSHQAQVQGLGSRLLQDEKFQPYAAAVASGARRGKLLIDVKAALTSAPGSAGALVAPDRQPDVTQPARIRHTIRSLLDVRPTTSGTIEYQRQTLRTNNADVVSEGELKPESFFEFERAEAKVATIAHWTKASKQVLADAPQLLALVDGELTYGLNDKEETQLLYGTGLSGELEGMMTIAASYAPPFAFTDATYIDKLRLAQLQARLAKYPVTGFILHPTDWARIETTKDGEGRYIIGDPRNGGVPTLWGKPVIECDSIQEGNFLTGAFGLASQLFDRETATVMISDEDSDNFVRNMVTILAEERVALVNRRPDALVTGEF